MKRILPILIILALIAAGGVAVRHFTAEEKGQAGGDIVLYGNVGIRDARLAFAESELVATVDVEEGQRVEAGQVLGTLRSDRLRAELKAAQARHAAQAQALRRLENGTRPETLEQARAEVEAGRVRVNNARRDFERIQATAARGASTARELDASQAELDLALAELRVREEGLALAELGPREEDLAEARAGLAALEAGVELLQLRLKDTRLLAPEAGIVQARILEPGERADPSRPAISLALTQRKWVRAYLSGSELGLAHPGQAALVQSDSWPDKKFEAQVGFLSPSAEFTPKSIETADLRTQLVYEIRLWVQDPEDQLRLGMPVTITLDSQSVSLGAQPTPQITPQASKP